MSELARYFREMYENRHDSQIRRYVAALFQYLMLLVYIHSSFNISTVSMDIKTAYPDVRLTLERTKDPIALHDKSIE